MSNIKDSQSINRFNGQYLKCVVTNYESTMTILKNSGTLIVHRPLDEDYNYLYLGNEFLSSGYGQKDIETRDKLTYLANTYTDTFSYFNNAYSYSLNYIEEDYNDLVEKLKDYVEIDGGNISYTTITYPPDGGKTFNTADIILEGPEADYEDLKVESLEKFVNNTPYIEDMVMPVGDQILKVEMVLNGKRNNSGGVAAVEFNFNHLNSVLDPYIFTGKNSKIYSPNAVNAADTFRIRCSLLYDKNMFYFIQEGDNKIVNKAIVKVAKTPQKDYKNYPKLEKNGINIISDFNALEEHEISLSGVNIIGKHTISLIAAINEHEEYSDDITIPNIASIEEEENALKPSNYYVGNIGNASNKYVPMREFIDDDVYFDIKYGTYMISFVVPNKWKAYEVYFIENNTGIVHNWTGAVHAEYSSLSDIQNDVNMIQIGRSRFVNCDKYTIIMSAGVQCDGKLLIRTYDTGIEEQEVVIKNSTRDIFSYNNNPNIEPEYNLLYNENFTAIYWLTYENLGNFVNDQDSNNIAKNKILSNILRNSYYNAANAIIQNESPVFRNVPPESNTH